MMFPYQTEVTRGIAYLEEHHPGWREKIDLVSLNIAKCDWCVLGQVFGSGYENFVRLGIQPTGFEIFIKRLREERKLTGSQAGVWCDAHGFRADQRGYAALNAEWRRQLSERPSAACAAEQVTEAEGGRGVTSRAGVSPGTPCLEASACAPPPGVNRAAWVDVTPCVQIVPVKAEPALV